MIGITSLQQVRVFESVARHRSFTRAAEELELTQPAISAQVRALEEALGTRLFERTGRRVELTQAGEALLEYARRILALLEDARAAVEDLEGLRRGRIALTTVTTPGAYLLPRLLGAFRERHPGIRVTLEVTNRATVRRRLLEGEADLTVMGRPPEGLEDQARAFLPNHLVVLAAPAHPLAGEGRVTLDRLAQEPFVMREPGSGTRLAVEDHFRRNGLRCRVGLEVGDNSGVKEAVAAGLGVSILSRQALDMELALGRLVLLDVRGFPLRRQWYVVRSPRRRPSRAAEAFEAFLVESAPAILQRRAAAARGAGERESSGETGAPTAAAAPARGGSA